MDITKSREEFEKWAIKKFGDCIDISMAKNGDGGYMAWDVAFAWHAWIASRESIEVELPAKVLEECEFDRGHNFGIDYCIVSLEESGIRIKGGSE